MLRCEKATIRLPNCPAANGGTPEMFGKLFPGILGVSIIDPPRGRCCANPLESLAQNSNRYIVHSAFSAPTISLLTESACVPSDDLPG